MGQHAHIEYSPILPRYGFFLLYTDDELTLGASLGGSRCSSFLVHQVSELN